MSESLRRCGWAKPIFTEYIIYHDTEWGVPVYDDKKQFEFLILESAQAGLSWSTVLKKRDGYRKAFVDFDVEKVALFGPDQVEELMHFEGIIKNRLKIQAAINNAQKFIAVQKEFGSFCNYIWQFTGGKPIINTWKEIKEVPATSPQSDALSKDLKNRGFKFVGSTIMYAHMQAVGMINDHTMDCFRYHDLAQPL